MPLPAALASILSKPIVWLLGLVGVGIAFQGLSNLVGSVTGHNPTADVTATMMQTMVPLIVSLMPVVMMMNMMMSMMSSITKPLETLTRPTIPSYVYMM